jgi:ABC-type uncharacterized transport system permease subunit
VKLIRCLCLSVPGCAVLGAAFSLFLQLRAPWVGIEVGALVGVFLGLLYADVLPREWADFLLGPNDAPVEHS